MLGEGREVLSKNFPREQQWSDVEKVVSFKSLHQNWIHWTGIRISEWQTFVSLADYSVSHAATEIRLSLRSPKRDSGPLVFSSQVMVRFISGGLCGSNRCWEGVGKSLALDFPLRKTSHTRYSLKLVRLTGSFQSQKDQFFFWRTAVKTLSFESLQSGNPSRA